MPLRNFALDYNSPPLSESFTSGQMLQLNDITTSMDVNTTDHFEQARVQTLSELDPFIFIQHDVKIPTRKEARMARAQFLALCWALFLIGWAEGSKGSLLPRIQKSYHVCYLPIPLTVCQPLPVPMNSAGWVRNGVLDISFWKCGQYCL